ncbi:MAG: hypothetical protein J6W10_08865 [Kiritimatiellae bacterium]|nr:hypothetical protein [Kiritimatiellia bacterium]
MSRHKWSWFRAGRIAQVALKNGDDIANLASLDKKYFMAMSLPIKSVRFDKRMLELMDTDKDGRIRISEVLAAIEFLKAKGVDFNTLFKPSKDDESALADIVKKEADLAAIEPSDADKKAMAEWEEKTKSPEVAVLGEKTADAVAAFTAVEALIDAFFVPAADMPLVMEEPDKVLPLDNRLNPAHREALFAFRDKCVKEILGDVESLDFISWGRVKAAFAPYRAHQAAKPVMNADMKGRLEDEERVLRYKLGLLEFLENFVNMKRLYSRSSHAMFQIGTLRIDSRELVLSFDVESEAAHSALAVKSNCCVLYLKLTNNATKATRSICSVVTKGTVSRLYVGRNGVFHDLDGNEWEAVVTKIVESQVSLGEAFWLPWKKVADGISSMVKKFLGEKQAVGQKTIDSGSKSAESGGAAMASSVAAIGIAVGMIGAAAASFAAVFTSMSPKNFAISLAALILVVSLPSVILTWFKLRRRDIGAILNASGWAINRPMAFSIKRASEFTRCLPCTGRFLFWFKMILLAAIAAGAYFGWKHYW